MHPTRQRRRDFFDAFRKQSQLEGNVEWFNADGTPYLASRWHSRPPASWMIVAGFDERGYAVCVQHVEGETESCMVRVGCRYFTLKQARAHWVSLPRAYNRNSRRTAAQILWLIGHGLHIAAARIKRFKVPKFNTTPRKWSPKK